jgi:hypothetical protein
LPFCTALLCGLLWAYAGPARATDREVDLERLVPAQGLTLYLGYDGLDARADAWKATAAWQILNGTPAGGVIAAAARSAFDRLRKNTAGGPLDGVDIVALQEHLAHQGFAYASLREAGKDFTIAIVRGLGRPDRADRLKDVLALLVPAGGGQAVWTPVDVRGRKVNVMQTPKNDGGLFVLQAPQAGPSWWLEGDTLILVRGPNDALVAFGERDQAEKDLRAQHDRCVGRVMDAIDARSPNASAHPLLVEAHAVGRDIGGFEPNGLFASESATGEGVIGQALTGDAMRSVELVVSEALGVTHARRVVARWGFRGKALVTDVRFEALEDKVARGGLLATAGVRKDRLPPIVRGAGAFVVVAPRRRPDPEVLAVVARSVAVREEYQRYLEATRLVLADEGNRRALGSLVERLGPAWCLYASPAGASAGEAVPALVADVEDAGAVEQALDATASRLNAFFREREFGGSDPAGPQTRLPALVLEKLPGPERGYRLIAPGGRVPWLTDDVQPTVALGDSFAVFAADPESARAALAAGRRDGGRWEPSGETAGLFACLPTNLSLLAVGNPRDSSWPEVIMDLPATAGPALERFMGIDPADAPSRPQPPGLLSLLGIGPAASSVAGKGGKTLKAEDLRALIFPSVLAVGSDPRGLRILAFEALPLGCVGVKVIDKREGLSRTISIEPRFLPGR